LRIAPELSRRLRRAAVGALGVAAMLVVPSIAAPAQEADEKLLKVAFIYNFAKFTTWPDAAFSDARAPVVLCVVGKHDLGDAFETVQGKAVGGRTVAVKYLSAYRNKDQCNVVYVAASEKQRLDRIVSTGKETHALTVSDMDDFAESGGIIRMVRGADDRIGFEINARAAEESGLKLSSKLLNLAKRLVN
jgi:hypothetical protein